MRFAQSNYSAKNVTMLIEIAEKAQKLRDMPVMAKKELNALNDFEVIKNYKPDCLE